MPFKIRGGTTTDASESLCATCRNATIVRGPRLEHDIVECGMLSGPRRRVTFPVTFCTDYSDRRMPTLRGLEEIAWVLRTDNRTKTIGFVPSRKLTFEERFVLSEDDLP